MIRLRSTIFSLFLSVTFIFSFLHTHAAEVTIPSYGNFAGATITGDVFEFPTGASDWAGFAATNEGGGDPYYPFVFSADGQVTVNAAVPSGGTATLRFVFEYLSHPNNTPTFEVSIPISGSTIQNYTATLPAQGDGTYSNFVFYIVERDTPVQIQDIAVSYDDPDSSAGQASETTINQWAIFDGTTIADGGIFEFPAAAETWAGFSNDDNSAYPFSFSDPGQISFTAAVPSGGTADVRFRFEKNPYPNVTPDYDTAVVTVSGSTSTVYTIDIPSQGDNTFSSFLFFINDRDTPVQLGDVIISDDVGLPGGGTTTPTNGVSFTFEEATGGSAAYSYDTDPVEVTSTEPQSFSISIPAYSDTSATFQGVILRAIGEDQSIAVNDVTLTVGGVTYGGSGSDTLIFDTPFGGVAYDSNSSGNVYTHLSTAETWGGFLLNSAQSAAQLPANGLVFADTATITFTANLVDTNVTLPPEYNGETAFSNGVIDTSEDTGTGRDSDPPYRWSAYVSWYNLDAGDTQGSFVSGDNWGQLSDLPATWNAGVITLAPNTASYSAWSEEGSDDGIYFLEQTLKIEGTQGTSAILGQTVNFSGTVDSYTLDSRYTVTAFIKATDPSSNFTPVVIEEVVLSAAGNFAISADLPSGDYVPQLGFVLSGRNANPTANWGNIQISNLDASYEETTSITEGNFTNGSNAYWGFTSGVEFNTDGGYGPVAGQVVMTNGGSSRDSVYISSNQANWASIDSFGMVAGSTYDVSYYMNRISGNDLGLVQFVFNNANTGETTYTPSDIHGTIHDNANPTNGTWAQYTQSIEVPAGTTRAVLYVISGAGSVIAFDQISVSEVVAPTNNFASWASNNGLSGADAAFNADPDNDGIPNGLESFLGTLPGSRSGGMSAIAKIANGLSMQHSRNSAVYDDVTASYEWSSDLSTWNASGATVGGSTVTITAQDDTPSTGTTTATATVSGTELDTVFIKVSVSND